MSKLLSKQELCTHLEDFRKILGNFDYSSIKNIRFLNLESLYSYMDNIKDNPFTEQHTALEQELDAIQPYLPFVSSERASEFLTAMSNAHGDEEVAEIKKAYTKKLRIDFVNMARTLTTDSQWTSILVTCEEIRMHKEEMCLASY